MGDVNPRGLRAVRRVVEELDDPLRRAGHHGPVAPDGDRSLDEDRMGGEGIERG